MRRVLVCAAGEGQRRAHLAVHERRVDADERRERRGEHYERAHLADDVASGGEQADADDGAGGDGDGLAQAERALEADGRLLLCAAFIRLVAHGRSFQRADRAGRAGCAVVCPMPIGHTTAPCRYDEITLALLP